MNIIVGTTSKISGKELKNVTINGHNLVSSHLIDHGCSFSWGYHGHGPRYLAEALLINLGYSVEFASKNMTKVSENLIATLPDNWRFTELELKNKIDEITSD